MTMREEFEAWYGMEIHPELCVDLWEGWKAATERAAKDHAALCDRFYARGMNAAECAAAIRGCDFGINRKD